MCRMPPAPRLRNPQSRGVGAGPLCWLFPRDTVGVMRGYRYRTAIGLIALALRCSACGGDSADLPASDDLADGAAVPIAGDGAGEGLDDGLRAEGPGMIAFASERDGNWEIYVMDPNGDNQRNVSRHPGNDITPAWSPDGKSIAFVSIREDIRDIFVMDADGANQRNITDSRRWESDPAWSPDGRHIAFSTTVDRVSGIHIMDSDGANLRSVNNNAPDGPWQEANPTWSPDGKTIVYEADAVEANAVLYAVDADGANRRQLTDPQAGDLAAAWSPDGEAIAFVRWGNWQQIHLMDPSGANVRPLTGQPATNASPTWSPDGETIAFISTRDGNGEIYTMDADDGGAQRRLTTDPAEDWDPDWSR